MKREKILLEHKKKRMKIVKLRDSDQWTWDKIAKYFGVSRTSVILRYQKEKGIRG